MTAVAGVVLSLVVCSPVFATTTGYAFAGQVGGAGNGPGEFGGGGGPAGIAVVQSTGDVFVSDPGHTLGDGTTLDPRVERFDAGGVFESAFSIEAGYHSPLALAVDSSGSGSVYVAVTDAGTGGAVVLKYSAAGGFAYALEDVSGSGIVISGGSGVVAVDPVSGNVFVAATGLSGGVIAVFDGGSGELIGSIEGSSSPETGFDCSSSLAVDGASRLYVADGCKSRVYQYSTAGVFGGVVDDGSRGIPYSVAADPVSNEVFVGALGSAGWQVTRFSAGGVSGGQSFGRSQIAGLAGIAVDHSSATVYAADYALAGVGRFTRFEGPTVATTTSASLAPTSEALSGTIDPGGVSSTYHFEYGPDTTYGAQTDESDPVTASGEVPATAIATGLLPNTTYHFRIVGSNASGSIAGNDQTFTTPPAPPVLVGGSPALVSSITATGATLNATLNPNGYDMTYHFEYGTTTAYGKTTPEADGGSGNGEVTVSQPTGRLFPATTYHVRVVATSNGLTSTGDDATFTTGELPVAALTYPTAITTSEATLAGQIDTHGADGSYTFSVESLDSSYSTTTAAQPTPTGAGMKPVTARLTGLPPGETFEVVLSVASNQATVSDSIVFATRSLTTRHQRPTPNLRCADPTLDPYTRHPHPGQTITLTGRDLGTGGTATLNGKQVSPHRWTPSRIAVQIPRRATGTQALTVDCGQRSNTIAIKISPTNKFTITNVKVNTRTATLRLRLPGAGKIRTTSRHTHPKTTKIARPGTTTIKIKLTPAAANTLANTGKLKTTIHIRYTPHRGQPNTKTRTLIFRRAAAKANRR